jgi:hypothetical protein
LRRRQKNLEHSRYKLYIDKISLSEQEGGMRRRQFVFTESVFLLFFLKLPKVVYLDGAGA